jgi:hypothetical protein
MSQPGEIATGQSARGANRAALCLFVALVLAGLAALWSSRGSLIIEDDARYYTVIAEQIVKTGRSTFDGQVLTNGYHPLWMVVLVGMAATTGLSDFAIAAVELLLVAGGVALMLSCFRSPSLAVRLVFVTLFAVLATPLVCRGMEISLLIFATGLFVRLLFACVEEGVSSLWAGLAAMLAIGARLDAAVFIVPMLLLVLGLRRSFAPLVVMAGGGATYALFNLWLFGIAFPVSGAVKSLGGVQVNYAYINQIFAPFQRLEPVAGAVSFLRSTTGKFTLLAGLCLLAVAMTGRSRATPYLLGYLVGLSLFLAKLLFGSSWVIWSWYGFPMFLGLLAFFLALDVSAPRSKLALVAALFVALGGLGWVLRSNGLGQPPQSDFEEINKLAAQHFAPVFKGERVAMGDRAGSFAHYYRGPVTQTEGLVNDRGFLDVLRKKGDVKALLCARGVRYLLAYQVDLGSYDQVSIPVLRRALTQYDAPAMTFSRKDEVGRVFDLKRFDAGNDVEADSYLYVWRLGDCPA